jgi:hypothetical protein
MECPSFLPIAGERGRRKRPDEGLQEAGPRLRPVLAEGCRGEGRGEGRRGLIRKNAAQPLVRPLRDRLFPAIGEKGIQFLPAEYRRRRAFGGLFLGPGGSGADAIRRSKPDAGARVGGMAANGRKAGPASGKAGGRASAVIPLGARSRVRRAKHAFIEARQTVAAHSRPTLWTAAMRELQPLVDRVANASDRPGARVPDFDPYGRSSF